MTDEVGRVHRPDAADSDSPRPSALDLAARLRGRRLAVFLDYDGTLTPIVERPEDALLSDAMRAAVRRLAARCKLAVVSGRDRADVARLVGLDELYYAGSHGFDISGPHGFQMEHEAAQRARPGLVAAADALDEALATVAGAAVERKRSAVAVHYRRVAEAEVARVRAAVDRVAAAHPELRQTGGKKVFELRPRVEWDKGRAVLWLLDALGLAGADVTTLYIGDDETDEDAFAALAARGAGSVGILVTETPRPSAAAYRLRDPEEVQTFLERLDAAQEGGG
jgi:trehalose 6-phosphate phosphatase